MKEIIKLLNLSINSTENPYKIIDKMNMKVFVIFLLNMWKKIRMNLFYKHDYKYKIKLFY